jgi:hypothetical protein
VTEQPVAPGESKDQERSYNVSIASIFALEELCTFENRYAAGNSRKAKTEHAQFFRPKWCFGSGSALCAFR